MAGHAEDFNANVVNRCVDWKFLTLAQDLLFPICGWPAAF